VGIAYVCRALLALCLLPAAVPSQLRQTQVALAVTEDRNFVHLSPLLLCSMVDLVILTCCRQARTPHLKGVLSL
jgi:hypothetical protein